MANQLKLRQQLAVQEVGDFREGGDAERGLDIIKAVKKDYKKWHPIKQRVNNVPDKRPFFHEREIWFCYLGENVGFEQDGGGDEFMRPVVIIRKFNNEIFWAIPLTRSGKKTKYYFSFTIHSSGPSTAVLSQIRLIDARRLSRKIGDISETDFEMLKKKLKALLP